MPVGVDNPTIGHFNAEIRAGASIPLLTLPSHQQRQKSCSVGFGLKLVQDFKAFIEQLRAQSRNRDKAPIFLVKIGPINASWA